MATTRKSRSLLASSRSVFSILSALTIVLATSYGTRAQNAGVSDSTKIVIGQASTGLGEVLVQLAVEEGFFKKADLDVERQRLDGADAAMTAFAAGKINVLSFAAPGLVQYVGEKVISGKAFAEIVDNAYDIVTTKDIKSVADFKGKMVGVSSLNSGDYIFIIALMQHYGLKPTDVTFVNSGGPLNRITELTNGKVQVVATVIAQRESAAKIGTVLFKADDSPVKFPGNVMVARSDLIENHKPLLKKLVGALSGTLAWIHANPDAAAADCAKFLGISVTECAESNALNLDHSRSSKYTWSSTLALNVEGFQSAIDVMAILDPKTVGLTVNDLVDTSIAGNSP